MLKIRRISQRENQLKAWEKQYQVTAIINKDNTEKRYFKIGLKNDDQQIQLFIDMHGWCQHRWPHLAHYAWDAVDNQSMCEIFKFENDNKPFFAPSFYCYSVDVVNNSKIERFGLSVFEENLGTVILEAPFEGLPTRNLAHYSYDNLLLSMDWVLGRSYISASLLGSLALGDVLCIQQLTLNMTIAGQMFARFQKQEEGLFMIEELISTESDENKIQSTEDYQDEVVRPFNINEMNIQLSFVLGSTDIKVNELSNIQLGSIFSIGENKEREVKVYANKQLIAEGELLYIGDSEELGLEITRIISLGDKRV
ncbi:FliM/FliN family flagellar motor switch protein [Providencia vermicola]|uniref:FliM/FliN family flagellar motor switch protein n=1 Tax=Providencia vermicola TaxID=333965 RepID=UPI003D2A44B2